MNVIHLTEYLPEYLKKISKLENLPNTYEEILSMCKGVSKARWNQKIKARQKLQEEMNKKKNTKENLEKLLKKQKDTDKDPA